MICPLLSINNNKVYDSCIKEKCEWWNIETKGCDPINNQTSRISQNKYIINRGKTTVQLTSTDQNYTKRR